MDDHFNSSRLNEEDMFDLVRTPAEDGSQFLNESGPGMEEERRDEAQTSIECDEDSQFGGHPQSGEVYEASDDQMQ
jgi:hypothetical protein